jgi:hypothetical protein
VISQLLEALVCRANLHLSFLYWICDFDLVLLAHSTSSSGMSLSFGGSIIVGAPKAGGPQDTVEAHGSKGLSDGAVGGDRVLDFGAAIAAGVVAHVVTRGGSLAPEMFPEGNTNVMAGETATGDPTASAGPAGGASPSTTADDDDVFVEESGVILGHPTLRDLGDVSLDEAIGTARWALTQAQDVICQESGGINDQRWCLLLWASMLKG